MELARNVLFILIWTQTASLILADTSMIIFPDDFEKMRKIATETATLEPIAQSSRSQNMREQDEYLDKVIREIFGEPEIGGNYLEDSSDDLTDIQVRAKAPDIGNRGLLRLIQCKKDHILINGKCTQATVW